ncbi:MAG: ATPase [Bacteroidales bacterium 45-6]|nr:MAG: ATPase [Bacteroidales bacterium 45-6]
MIIVADGGSTKVDWAFIDKGELLKRIQTQGANPFYRSSEDMTEEWRVNLLPETDQQPIESVHFFGAGCANAEKNEVVRKAIHSALEVNKIELGSDLLGAAKALCGRRPGIACILGTGSNSGDYDGEKLIENVSPLGYILGDEGSGAVLGKLFVGACLKNQFSPGMKEAFLKETGLTPADIVDRVYRGSLPNRFLASFAPFIKKNLHEAEVYDLVARSFEDFLRRNVMQYDYQNRPVHFTGSVAFHFQVVLKEVADRLELKVGNIVASPMEGLIAYYS